MVGILAASSGSSAVAPLLPAVLSLFGGKATYLVSRQGGAGTIPADRMIIADSATAFSLRLFTGAPIGGEMQSRADAYRESAAYKKSLVDVVREVEAYRRSLALREAVSQGKVDEVFAKFARRQLAR